MAKKRDILSRTKQARDSLRIDNVKLRKKCGLIGQEALLRDLEVGSLLFSIIMYNYVILSGNYFTRQKLS